MFLFNPMDPLDRAILNHWATPNSNLLTENKSSPEAITAKWLLKN